MRQTDNNIDMCTFCSVKMFGTGAYTGDNGETVYFDYVKPENLKEFCRKHCTRFSHKIRENVRKTRRNKDTPEIYISNSAFDKAVEDAMVSILIDGELNSENKKE